ncbi:hypothetical protein FJT64_012222 [Amphibalanus amphitrite]|uniref:Uncharacterized protein n=1 Tax=Amphibalanus amphitrite TaxID=1232801 RepID=A0A6A4V4K7_AMPAM|nr:hypothetical protein FJT64_012222 [Amphibalanus amphitrite]
MRPSGSPEPSSSSCATTLTSGPAENDEGSQRPAEHEDGTQLPAEQEEGTPRLVEREEHSRCPVEREEGSQRPSMRGIPAPAEVEPTGANSPLVADVRRLLRTVSTAGGGRGRRLRAHRAAAAVRRRPRRHRRAAAGARCTRPLGAAVRAPSGCWCSSGASALLRDADGRTPLAEARSAECVRELVSADAALSAADLHGVLRSRPEVLRQLLDLTVQPDGDGALRVSFRTLRNIGTDCPFETELMQRLQSSSHCQLFGHPSVQLLLEVTRHDTVCLAVFTVVLMVHLPGLFSAPR